MNSLAAIIWDVSPKIFSIGSIEIRWYGLLYAMTFLVGLYLLQAFFRKEKIDEEWADKVFIYMLVGTIIGARFGHIIFYSPKYYFENPGEILKIWHGGLASHGGAIGISTALWIFSKRISKKPTLWILDRVITMVALGGLFIRTGNLMNSEIIGTQTDVAWAFVFKHIDNVPRHPAQMYEALTYFSLFLVLMFVFWKTNLKNRLGFMFGLFLTFAFTGRFLIEFVKENQEVWERGMTLNMGQILSIPCILVGLYLLFRKPQYLPEYKETKK